MRLKDDALTCNKTGQKATIIKNISEPRELGHTKVLNEYLHFPLSITFARTQLGNNYVILMLESETQLFDFFFRKPKQKAEEESLFLANTPIIRLWGKRTTKLSF